jgi:hypothetical protein
VAVFGYKSLGGDKMNNTDYFNNHRAEALKLIAESVHPTKTVRRFMNFYENDVVTVAGYEYNPCAQTTEGKAQLLDLIMTLREELKFSDIGEINALNIFFVNLESPEATCIAYLDMIRKV